MREIAAEQRLPVLTIENGGLITGNQNDLPPTSCITYLSRRRCVGLQRGNRSCHVSQGGCGEFIGERAEKEAHLHKRIWLRYTDAPEKCCSSGFMATFFAPNENWPDAEAESGRSQKLVGAMRCSCKHICR
jgi:hypothetical protein